jgi:N-sulfoglucosamine sulfohydrolase
VRQAGETAAVGRRKASKYLRRDAEELYDVTADPLEVNNLAGDPNHRELVKRLRAQVQDFRVRTKDPWLINDDYK